MATTPFEEKPYVQSDAVTRAQQALQAQQAAKPGDYRSQWQGKLDSALGKIQNRPDFSYDVNSDALYQQVAQNYLRKGQQAMMDTAGQAAALTGGYGNSYGQTAGQQVYNQYLQGLTELVPQYQQLALEQYRLEGEDLLKQYQLLLDQENRDYDRYRDTLEDYYGALDRLQAAYDQERSYDYSRYADSRDFAYGQYMDQRNHQYRTDRDAVEDSQWLQQLQYQQERDRIQDEQWQKEYQERIRQYNQDYELSLMAKTAASSGSRSSSGGRSSGSKKTAQEEQKTEKTPIQTFTEYMNARSREGMTTQQAAQLITHAANTGIIEKKDQLNYMLIYG